MVLKPEETALLVIDVQNTYLKRPERAALSPKEQAHYDLWTPFHERLEKLRHPEHPRPARALSRERASNASSRASPARRATGASARSATASPAGTTCLLPRGDWESQIVDDLAPVARKSSSRR